MARIPYVQQALPGANVLTTIFSFPAKVQFAIPPASGSGRQDGTLTHILVSNHGDEETTFRVAFAIQGAADTEAQYQYYDIPLKAKDTFIAELGLPIWQGDVVRVRSGNGRCAFQVCSVREDA